MAIQSREDLTYLEIYRPVEDGLNKFLEKVGEIGNKVFGTDEITAITRPVKVVDEEGSANPVMSITGIKTPRIEVYGPSQLKLDLLDRRVDPKLNYASRFRWVASRLIRRPEDLGYRQIVRDEEELQVRIDRKKRLSLSFMFEQIGYQYDITDQNYLEVVCRAIDFPVDPPLEHLGQELALIPHPGSPVTRMLVAHAGLCLRGLGRHSSKAANPYSPTALRIPFARMPANATQPQINEFIGSVEAELPVRPILGGFKDHVGGSSWVSKRAA